MKSSDKVFLVVGLVALVATGAVTGMLVFGAGSSTTTAGTSESSQTSSTVASSSASQASSTTTQLTSQYKDGTYSAKASYAVPHGNQNTITTKITIANGSITAVKVDDAYTDRESGEYIDSFESGLQRSAVGTSIANYSPQFIGGASLTTAAFRDTLDTIRTDAAA